MAGIVLVPAKLAEMNSGGEHHLVLVVNHPQIAKAVTQELATSKTTQSSAPDENPLSPTTYVVQVDTTPTDAERDLLRQQVSDGKITGFLWLTDEALARAQHHLQHQRSCRLRPVLELRNAVRTAVMKQHLAEKGMSGAEVDSLLMPIDSRRFASRKAKKAPAASPSLLPPSAMVMLLYVVVMIYGIAVMRSVIEEKSTRILEVLLSSVTAKELLAGKILGVGAVGLTQILIWVICARCFPFPDSSLPGHFWVTFTFRLLASSRLLFFSFSATCSTVPCTPPLVPW